MATFLGEGPASNEYRDLISAVVSPDFVERAQGYGPDERTTFERGEEWLRTVPSKNELVKQLEREKDYHRATTFVVRTFLYKAYADVHHLPFTPDATRSNVLTTVVEAEQRFRRSLLNALEKSFQKQPEAYDFGLTRRITPLAAIVFDRAGADRGKILDHLARLRKELAPLRHRLDLAESVIFHGTGAGQIAAKKKWHAVFQEIERTFGEGEGLLTVESALSFAENASGFIDDPAKMKNLPKSLLGLPVSALRRFLARRSAIEIHRLRDSVPATGRLQRRIEQLFGRIDDDDRR